MDYLWIKKDAPPECQHNKLVWCVFTRPCFSNTVNTLLPVRAVLNVIEDITDYLQTPTSKLLKATLLYSMNIPFFEFDFRTSKGQQLKD